MASTISTPTTYLLCSSTQKKKKKSPIFSISSSLLLHPQTTNYRLSTSITQLGIGLLSPWNGLSRHLGVPKKQKYVRRERKERSKGMVVHASLFGVGAPEALVIGVVALLVFGPKGLAEVARNLGKTLRTFQPTIRELQDVSREFKSTLEREIGLDDIPPPRQSTSTSTTSSTASADNQNSQTALDPNGTPLANKLYSTEDYLRVTEEQLQATAVQQQVNPQEQSVNQQDADPPTKPFNIGEVLVEAQMKSAAAAAAAAKKQEEDQVIIQEAQSEVEPRPKEVAPTVSPPKNPESVN